MSCPWCVIGYRALDAALIGNGDSRKHQTALKTVQLNPNMPAEGQNRSEHIQQKYGISKQQSDAARKHIELAAGNWATRLIFSNAGRVHNTFDAHRLIHWVQEFGLQTELKLALFDLFFIDQGNTDDKASLLSCVEALRLDSEQAEEVLNSNRYSDEVMADLAWAQQQGISAVPCFILGGKYMVSGGQSIETFKQAIKEMLDSDAGSE